MMPSLFKYFALVGALLLGLLVLTNFVLEPDGPPRSAEKAPPKVKVVVKHDPGASRVERLRVEEAAQKAADRGETPAGLMAAVARPAEPVTAVAAQTQAEPVPALAAATAATPAEDAAARAERLAQKKAKAQRERKQRLARARALEQAALRQQDQVYGYAPRPTYGPFGGWGQAQRW